MQKYHNKWNVDTNNPSLACCVYAQLLTVRNYWTGRLLITWTLAAQVAQEITHDEIIAYDSIKSGKQCVQWIVQAHQLVSHNSLHQSCASAREEGQQSGRDKVM